MASKSPETAVSIVPVSVLRFYHAAVLIGVRVVIFLRIRPNTLTLISLAFAILSGIAAAKGYFKLSAFELLLSGICDLLDGPTARATGENTRFGALLDSTVDRVSDAAPLVGLVLFYSQYGWPAVIPCLVILSAFTVSYIRARAEALHVILPFLWMRRAERLLLICCALCFGNLDITGIDIPAPFVMIGISIVGVLSIGGAITAMRQAYVLMK
jgi:CDP-diacylglycerol---glycerol-3-phosphate 3-phosphatidyltransferase